MPIVTLTTDMGHSDPYVAIIKGQLHKQIKHASIVDISHEVEKYNIQHAAYILKNTFQNFPDKSVHILAVDTNLKVDTAHVAVLYKGHYFIGNDNGIFALLFDEFPEFVVEIFADSENDIASFPSKTLYTKIAAQIINEGSLENIGEKRSFLNEKHNLKPVSNADGIRGYVIHIDSYGNIISNIDKKLFEESRKGRDFLIDFRSRQRNIDRDNYGMKHIANSYNEVAEVQLVSIFNSFGLLEIALNKANAHKLLGLALNDMINIDFYDS